MQAAAPDNMQAVAIDHFGGLDALEARRLPVPDLQPTQVLVHVEAAGVGNWDIAEREGTFAEALPGDPQFPYVLGAEGAGTIARVGRDVDDLREGDRVYGLIMGRNPKGGFYSQYAAVDREGVWRVPGRLSAEEAGALPVDAAAALRGLRDVLLIERGDTLLVFGASGGLGHMAVQIAKRMGAKVFAVASGEDGVRLCRELGVAGAADGHREDFADAARDFAPGGFDAALLTAGGTAADRALELVRGDGRAAYPRGAQPEPNAPDGLHLDEYSAAYDPQLMQALNRVINAGRFQVHVARSFPLEEAAQAQRALAGHHLGRVTLRPS